MSKRGKRYRSMTAAKEHQAVYNVDEAIGLVRTGASAGFDETVDVAINLGVDAKKSDQSVRGSTVLPRGTGKTVRVVINDRGPYSQGRIIDLSRGAARRIDMVQDGTTKVRIEVVGCKKRYGGC